MANRRIESKRKKNQLGMILEQLSCKMDELGKGLEKQGKIMEILYKDHQDKKEKEKEAYLKHCIAVREDMLKDITRLRNTNNLEALKLMNIYAEEYEQYLRFQGVEILTCKPGDDFDSEIAKPIYKDKVQPKYHNKVTRVYGNGYKWKGIMLKKIFVSVGISDPLTSPLGSSQ